MVGGQRGEGGGTHLECRDGAEDESGGGDDDKSYRYDGNHLKWSHCQQGSSWLTHSPRCRHQTKINGGERKINKKKSLDIYSSENLHCNDHDVDIVIHSLHLLGDPTCWSFSFWWFLIRTLASGELSLCLFTEQYKSV